MHHAAFEYASFDELNASYLRLRRRASRPPSCLDHGMTLLLLLRRSRRQQRRAAGRLLRRLGEVEGVDAHLRRVQGQPDRQFVDPERVAADRADGRRASRRSTPRRWRAATLPSRRRSRSRRRHEALPLRRGRGPRHGIVEDDEVVDRDDRGERHPLDEVRLLAPVQPRKFLAIGLNYADHIAESGMEAPRVPGVLQQAGRRASSAPATTSTCRASRACSTTRASSRRDRHALPARARRARARGDRRLHDRQRRLRARLAAAHADDDDGQVVRHARPARAVARHRPTSSATRTTSASGRTSTTSCARTATPAR